MSIATKEYGNIPTAKGEDDGTIFNEFLRGSRHPAEMKPVKWEEIRDIVEKYKVRHSFFPVTISIINPRTVYPVLQQGSLIFATHHHFLTLNHQDPIMTQFPLALAIEPRLLPLAEVNGFSMDSKVRSANCPSKFPR